MYTKIYVIECTTPNFWYVGSTFRELYDRIDEHSSHLDLFGPAVTVLNGWLFGEMCLKRHVPL